MTGVVTALPVVPYATWMPSGTNTAPVLQLQGLTAQLEDAQRDLEKAADDKLAQARLTFCCLTLCSGSTWSLLLHHQACMGCCSCRCGADWQEKSCTTLLLTAQGFSGRNADKC